ncbi:MAG: DUF1801 domain-containing protein [Gemmatimonadaceae bacterium]
MSRSSGTTVREYLDELPKERRDVVAKVRKMVLRHLPEGYAEAVSWGVISYEVPLKRYPDTYNKKPLCYVELAAHKSHYALYLMGAYAKPELAAALKAAFAKAGKKLDMGKSCLRFKELENLPPEAIGGIIASLPPDEMIACARGARTR